MWNVIATDGATNQMIDGNGYGMNAPGLYDPELIAPLRPGPQGARPRSCPSR